MELSYFHPTENKLAAAKLLETRQKNVVVFDYEKNKSLIIPYYMLNLENLEVDILDAKGTEVLTANTVKVGDCVGFNKDNESIVGLIKKINQKTVTLVTYADQQWRVPYTLLYRVYDAETSNNELQQIS